MAKKKKTTKKTNGKSGRKNLQNLRATDKVIAIFAADIHLSHKPPVWRSAEPDWYAAMKRPLDEITKIQKQFDCPVIYAGDIFDRWNSSAKLINFAIDNLPKGFAIPGQHDLPLHNLEDIKDSAYWTLVQAEVFSTLSFDTLTIMVDGFEDKVRGKGFPYGKTIVSIKNEHDWVFYIAIIHEYCWVDSHSYPGVPKESKFGKRISGVKKEKWLGYDIVIYGDNHSGFQHQIEDTQIFNCGTLMRRKSDEIDYQPQIGLLLNTGKIISHKLDISQDKYLISDKSINESEKIDLSDFIEELELLGDTALDFEVAVDQYFKSNKTKKEIKDIINKAMEK